MHTQRWEYNRNFVFSFLVKIHSRHLTNLAASQINNFTYFYLELHFIFFNPIFIFLNLNVFEFDLSISGNSAVGGQWNFRDSRQMERRLGRWKAGVRNWRDISPKLDLHGVGKCRYSMSESATQRCPPLIACSFVCIQICIYVYI